MLPAGDALRLCTVFISWHAYDFVHWPKLPERSIYNNLSKYAADRLASFEVITRRTEVMRQVIILPFIVLFLQIAGWSNLFEGWTWNPGVICIYGGFAIYLFYRSSRLQQAATRARNSIMVDLEREASNLRLVTSQSKATGTSNVIATRFGESLPAETVQKSTEEIINRIRGLQRGLFRPLMDNPIFQAIAWPSTGLGLLALLQFVL